MPTGIVPDGTTSNRRSLAGKVPGRGLLPPHRPKRACVGALNYFVINKRGQCDRHAVRAQLRNQSARRRESNRSDQARPAASACGSQLAPPMSRGHEGGVRGAGLPGQQQAVPIALRCR